MNVPNFRKIDLITYKPGRSLLSSKKKVIKLSANESAFGVGERVRNVLRNRKSDISKYPDSKFKKLIEDNIISIDFKLRTQYNKGLSPRNRGTAFRINDKNLDKLFDKEIIR